MTATDCVTLTGEFQQCIVGVYKSERNFQQTLNVQLAVELDTRKAAQSSKLDHTLDYAKLVGEVGFILETGKFLLLETAAEAIARYLLAKPIAGRKHSRPTSVTIELSKPRAISTRFSATVKIQRQVSDFADQIEATAFGSVDVICEYQECGIYRLNIAPGKGIPNHIHRQMHEREMALTGGLLMQGNPLKSGRAQQWPHGFCHSYQNPTTITQTILCIDSPAFLPEDEIKVDSKKTSGKLPESACKDFYQLPQKE